MALVVFERPEPTIRQAVLNWYGVTIFRVLLLIRPAVVDDYRQIQVVPHLTTTTSQQIAAQVVIVDALHDDYHRRGFDSQA